MDLISRNGPCPCGSGKKHKRCCADKASPARSILRRPANAKVAGYNAATAQSPSDRLLQAVALHQAGQHDQAKAAYQALLAEFPNGSDAMHYLHYIGMIAHQEGKYTEAATLIEQAIARAPNIPAFHCNLANAYAQSGQVYEAIRSYREAIRQAPQFSAAYFNLHTLLLAQPDLSQAIDCLQRAVDFAPDNAVFRFHLGMLLDYSGRPDPAAQQFAIAEGADDLCRALLDAWRYLKAGGEQLPRVSGFNLHTFRQCMEAARIGGLVLEFGVRSGSTIRQIAALAKQPVHGFDSFQGIPEAWHHEPAGSYSTHGQLPAVPDNVSLHVGWFDESLPRFLREFDGPVRFMNIDCDIYSSTVTILELLADRIVPGTVIVFDEYIGYKQWREDEFKAFQEAVAKYGWSYEYITFSFMTKQVGVRIIKV